MRTLILFLFGFWISSPLICQNLVTIEDIYNGKYSEQGIDDIKPLKNKNFYTTLKKYRSIHKYSYVTGEYIKTLFDLPDSLRYIYEYQISNDETKILFSTEIDALYRHSYFAKYFIYDINAKKLSSVFSGDKIREATFSPDGKKVAFVYNNNLYCQFLDTDSISQLTYDGKKNHIINGLPDWVYEEEFGFTIGYKWAHNSKNIAYYKINESHVKMYTITKYNDTYPQEYQYKYPKAGEENAEYSVHIYNFEEHKNINTQHKTNDSYIPIIEWLPNKEQLLIGHLNRLQNTLNIELYAPQTSQTKSIITDINTKYIDVTTSNFLYLPQTSESIILTSERDGYRHCYAYDYSGNLLHQITKGNYDVSDIYGVDSSLFFYYSSYEKSPLKKQIYKVKLDGSEKLKLSTLDGVNEATFNSNFSFFINQWSNANTPSRYSLCNNNGETIRVLEENTELKRILAKANFGKKEFFEFSNRDNISLNGYFILPQDFKKKKKYPVLMYVYGGPDSQMVLDEFNYMQSWFQVLLQKGYIIACIDNRGTGGRGEEFRKSTYMKLGQLEVNDQIDAAKHLASLPFVDSQRIGIYGWSYGGFMSLLCLEKGNNIFKIGISIAPVTSWKFYDSVYTERYMRTPKENENGYNFCPLAFAKDFSGKLLIIHGTADDNVHLQNSMMMMEELVKHNKYFDSKIYPNKQHGISGRQTRIHLFTEITNYIENNL